MADFNKTFTGRKARIEVLQSTVVKETGKQFEFLPDHPEDWRYRTHKIDYYHVNSERDLLIGIKLLLQSMRNSNEPTVIAALEQVRAIHKQFEQREAGNFFILFYERTSRNSWQIVNQDTLHEIRGL